MSRTSLVRVALVGSYLAAYRGAHLAGYFLNRTSQYAVTLSDPRWHADASWLRKLRYGFWALRAVAGSQLVVFTAMQHNLLPFRVLRRIARLLGREVVIDFYISVYDTLVDDRRSVMPGSRAAEKAMLADKAALMDADLILFLSEAERRYYPELVGADMPGNSTAVVPLVTPIRPMAELPWARGPSSIPTIAWWGYLGNALHGISTIVDGLATLAVRGQKFRMIFCPSGSPDELRSLRYSLIQAGIESRCEIDTVSTMQNGRLIDRLQAEVDVALGAFGGSRKAHTVPVNKVVDAMSFGIPCVTGSSRAFDEHVCREGLAMVPHADSDALAEALRHLLGSRDELSRLGHVAREEWLRAFSPPIFEQRLSAALASLASE